MKYLIFRQHIHKIIGGTIMTKVREIYRCQICGNVVEVGKPRSRAQLLWRADEADEGKYQ